MRLLATDAMHSHMHKKLYLITLALIVGLSTCYFLFQTDLQQSTWFSSGLLTHEIKLENLESHVTKASSPFVGPTPWKPKILGGRKQNLPFNSVEYDKVHSNASDEFTVILLTHAKRRNELPKTLLHLAGLPNLNQVIVIWNGEVPKESIRLPQLHFPVRILSNGRNSLNNRFLPLEIIETDAIFSMDDDMFPQYESVIFAFRIWQEFRERIVGFPGRGVTWKEGRWIYETKPCKISLVLTGLAFFHRKYLHLYTYEMPEEIRQRVSNVTNCEDIAMNFLVSHITQSPPIKVTPDNAWVCPNCDMDEKGKDSLWKDSKHFKERDECINYFSSIYGYTPLFKAEYRFDDNFHRDPRLGLPHCIRIDNKNAITKSYITISLGVPLFLATLNSASIFIRSAESYGFS